MRICNNLPHVVIITHNLLTIFVYSSHWVDGSVGGLNVPGIFTNPVVRSDWIIDYLLKYVAFQNLNELERWGKIHCLTFGRTHTQIFNIDLSAFVVIHTWGRTDFTVLPTQKHFTWLCVSVFVENIIAMPRRLIIWRFNFFLTVPPVWNKTFKVVT